MTEQQKLIQQNLTAILDEIERIRNHGTADTQEQDLKDLLECTERNVSRCLKLLDRK